MSYTANTAFEARISNNEFDGLCNIAGKFYASDVAADCSAGTLVKRSALLDCEGFTGIKNENAWKVVAATSSDTADEVIYACNTYETKMVGNYFIGGETLGLGIPAGRMGTFTRIDFDGQHRYRIGAGNISGTLSTNQYFTIDAGQYKVAAAAPTATGALYFKLIGTGKFTEGTRASFDYYDVVACKVSTVAE